MKPRSKRSFQKKLKSWKAMNNLHTSKKKGNKLAINVTKQKKK